MNAHIKKEERSQINNLTSHFKEPEKDKQAKLKASRRKEIVKIRVDLNREQNSRERN